jgi:hypothetical protein
MAILQRNNLRDTLTDNGNDLSWDPIPAGRLQLRKAALPSYLVWYQVQTQFVIACCPNYYLV